MRNYLSILIGLIGVYFFAYRPMTARLLANVALHSGIDYRAAMLMLLRAHEYERCNLNILDAAGRNALLANDFATGTTAFGLGVSCSPGNPAFRFKYGEALSMWSGYGAFALEEAIKLEPNNPHFKKELERLTKLQSPSP